MNFRTYQGKLSPQHPICTKCYKKTYAMYYGGRKDKVANIFFCKTCNTIYNLPQEVTAEVKK